jgi:hypothetical protein
MADFFSSSKDKPTITNTTSQPWEAAQPYLRDVMGQGQSLFNQTNNAKPWTSNVNAPMHAWQSRGLQSIYNTARKPVPGLAQAQRMATGLMQNNGMTPELQNVAGLFGQFANSENGLTSGQSRAAGYMDPFARGDYQEDPRMLAALQAREGRAMNSASTSFGGGRYGSNAIGRGVGSALAEAGDELMLTSNENARNRQLQASGMLGDLYTTGAGQKLQGMQGMGNLYEGGRSAGLAAAGMLPGLEALRWIGPDRMAQAGQTYTDRAQTERDALIKRYEGQQSGTAGWDALAKYVGAMSGMGKAGSTSSQVANPAKRGGFEKVMDVGGQLAGLLGAVI